MKKLTMAQAARGEDNGEIFTITDARPDKILACSTWSDAKNARVQAEYNKKHGTNFNYRFSR